jgi:hypothetical protein
VSISEELSRNNLFCNPETIKLSPLVYSLLFYIQELFFSIKFYSEKIGLIDTCSMVYAWFLHGLCMVSPWFMHGFSMVPPSKTPKSMDKPWTNHGGTMDKPPI